jgi:hypothetical protein
MSIDTSNLAFPKPTKKAKKSSSFGKKAKPKKEKDVVVFDNEVESMIDFYELHRGEMISIDNYRLTKKLRELASQWIRDVMRSQKCDDVNDVLAAWQQTIIHASEKVHISHKVGSFMNMFWLIKNDSNYLDVLFGKYDKEFKKNGQTTKIGWGDKGDFNGVEGGPSGIIV